MGPVATKAPFVSVINRWRVTAPRPPVPGRAGRLGGGEGVCGRGEARSGMFPEETEGSGGEEMEGEFWGANEGDRTCTSRVSHRCTKGRMRLAVMTQ